MVQNNNSSESNSYYSKFNDYFLNEIVGADNAYSELIEGADLIDGLEHPNYSEVNLSSTKILNLVLDKIALYKSLKSIIESILECQQRCESGNDIDVVRKMLEDDYGLSLDSITLNKLIDCASTNPFHVQFETQSLFKYFIKYFEQKMQDSVNELIKEALLILPNIVNLPSKVELVEPVLLKSINESITDKYQNALNARLFAAEKKGIPYDPFEVACLICRYNELKEQIAEIRVATSNSNVSDLANEVIQLYKSNSEIIDDTLYSPSQVACHILIEEYSNRDDGTKLCSYIKDLNLTKEGEIDVDKGIDKLQKFMQNRKNDPRVKFLSKDPEALRSFIV